MNREDNSKEEKPNFMKQKKIIQKKKMFSKIDIEKFILHKSTKNKYFFNIGKINDENFVIKNINNDKICVNNCKLLFLDGLCFCDK